MAMALFQFLVCAFVIIVAGSFLTKFADNIAELTGLGRLLVGSILLAGATSLPELAVDVSAVWMGMPDLAVGGLIGSSLANLLILAGLDLSHQSQGKMLSKQSAAHALSGSLSAAMTALVGLGLLTGKAFAEYTLLNLSPFAILLGVAYALGIRLTWLNERFAAKEHREDVPAEPAVPPGMTLKKAILGFSLSALAIIASGPFLASAAGDLAEASGLGKTFVGTTFVALSTSLPELVAGIAAIRMGSIDLAIGNIFGSNVFNMVLLIPLDAIQPQSLFAVVSIDHATTCMAVILATMVVIMGQLYRAESRYRFIEPDAYLVIAIVLGALLLLYYLPQL